MCLRPSLIAVSLVLTMIFTTILQQAPLAQTSSGGAAGGIVGWISIEPAGEAGQSQMLAIAGRAIAMRPLEGRYVLDVKRQGKAGASNARQGGAITLKPGVAAILSQSAVNIGPGDWLEIELKIYVGDREVFAASMKSVGPEIKL
jgi:hypothetical protein